MRLSKTNPAYAHLAHQHAIVSHTIALMQERYLGTDAQDPQDVMYCEGLPRDDSEVPEDEILLFVRDLQHKRLEIERQMQMFDFVSRAPLLEAPRMTSAILNPPKTNEPAESPAKKGGRRKRPQKRQ